METAFSENLELVSNEAERKNSDFRLTTFVLFSNGFTF